MNTFRHLKIFIAVAECGTMRKAAEQLYISQPSVSQAIQELEAEYQVQLFDRLSKRIYITESGKLFLTYARQIIHSVETMEEAMKREVTVPIVRIGASVTVGSVYISSLVQRFEEAMPGVDVRVVVDNTTNIENLVLRSEIDFGIVEGRLTSEDILQKKICEDEIVMVVGRSHPFYEIEQIQLSQLEGQSLIARESGSAERNQFEQFIIEENIHMVRKWSCTSAETIKQVVKEGRGIAILSKKMIGEELDQGSLRILNIEGVSIRRNFKLIVHKDKILPDHYKEYIKDLFEPSEDLKKN